MHTFTKFPFSIFLYNIFLCSIGLRDIDNLLIVFTKNFYIYCDYAICIEL